MASDVLDFRKILDDAVKRNLLSTAARSAWRW
jgi:hypothetical protein